MGPGKKKRELDARSKTVRVGKEARSLALPDRSRVGKGKPSRTGKNLILLNEEFVNTSRLQTGERGRTESSDLDTQERITNSGARQESRTASPKGESQAQPFRDDQKKEDSESQHKPVKGER